MDLSEHLRQTASECGVTIDADVLDDPLWDTTEIVHDWRNYVPSELRARWRYLQAETRMAIILVAIPRAAAEEWE